jgi:hypothetical protein
MLLPSDLAGGHSAGHRSVALACAGLPQPSGRSGRPRVMRLAFLAAAALLRAAERRPTALRPAPQSRAPPPTSGRQSSRARRSRLARRARRRTGSGNTVVFVDRFKQHAEISVLGSGAACR